MHEPNYVCETCGKSGYKSKSKLKTNKNFCSIECSSKNQIKKQEVVCLQCNKKFMKGLSYILKFPNHFCSRQCKSAHQIKKQEVVCLQCNKKFMKGLSYILKFPNHFCSRQCKGIHATTKQQIPCDQCGKYITKSVCRISKYKNLFCSNLCSSNFRDRSCDVECLVCKKTFKKRHKRTISNPRHCCSKECYRILQKYFKNWGSSRSKLEIEAEIELKKIFDFEILFNKKTIGYELDIYIPCLDLAFEINGPTHHLPIYGEERLMRTQRIDKEKFDECKKRNINLVVIDVSEDKNFKSVRQQRTNELIEIINKKIVERNYKQEIKQLAMSF